MSKKEDKQDPYTVGYGKPPKRTQFKAGQSGNPKGRPKGTHNLATVVEKTLREPVVVNENGRRKEITKREAIGKQLVNKSASGDLAAIRELDRVMTAGERSSQSPVSASADLEAGCELKEIKEKLLAKLLRS